MTADVAHEIRNPLSALGGFARRLSKTASGEKEKEYADIIRCEVNRLENILRDVIAFSREARFHLERHNIENVLVYIFSGWPMGMTTAYAKIGAYIENIFYTDHVQSLAYFSQNSLSSLQSP